MRHDGDDAAAIRDSLDDPAAFTAVFVRHYDAVHRFLRRRAEASIAEELATEAFLQAFESRKRYRLDRADARP